MSIDEQKEQAVYDAIAELSNLPRPAQRARICREVIKFAAHIAGWEVIFVDE